MHHENDDKFAEALEKTKDLKGIREAIATVKAVEQYGFTHALGHMEKEEREWEDYVCASNKLFLIGQLLTSISANLAALAQKDINGELKQEEQTEKVFSQIEELVKNQVPPKPDGELEEKLKDGCRDCAEIMGMTATLFSVMASGKVRGTITKEAVIDILQRTADALSGAVENVRRL